MYAAREGYTARWGAEDEGGHCGHQRNEGTEEEVRRMSLRLSEFRSPAWTPGAPPSCLVHDTLLRPFPALFGSTGNLRTPLTLTAPRPQDTLL